MSVRFRGCPSRAGHPAADDAAGAATRARAPGQILAVGGAADAVARETRTERTVREDVAADQRRRVVAGGMDECRVDGEWAQVVRRPDAVDSREDGLLVCGESGRLRRRNQG